MGGVDDDWGGCVGLLLSGVVVEEGAGGGTLGAGGEFDRGAGCVLVV